MPWDVRENFGNCRGFAVVKSDNDEIIACHTERAVADQHVVDLYAAESNSADGDPMQAAADEMKKKKRRKQEYDEHGNIVVNTDPEFVSDTTFVPTPPGAKRELGTYIQ